MNGEPFAEVRVSDDAVAATNDKAPVLGEPASRATGVAERRVLTLTAERTEIAIADATVRVPANVDARMLERVLTAPRSIR
jgi:hypothetical protein